MAEAERKRNIGHQELTKRERPRFKTREEMPAFNSNAYDLIGQALFKGISSGDISSDDVNEILEGFQADADIDLGKDYSVNLGYNQPSHRGMRDIFRATLTKHFK